MDAPAARTPEELLDRQEADARRRLVAAAVGLGDECCAAVDLGGRIRRHPLAALSAAAGLGWAAGPALLRGLRSAPVLAVALSSLLRGRPSRRG